MEVPKNKTSFRTKKKEFENASNRIKCEFATHEFNQKSKRLKIFKRGEKTCADFFTKKNNKSSECVRECVIFCDSQLELESAKAETWEPRRC